MEATFELNEGRRRLSEIIAALPPESPHWSEAQNRFQFVDRLLIECLGWSHPHMIVEKPDGAGGRSDYELGKPPKAILEAKREAVLFQSLPTGKPTAVRKLQPLLQASKEFEEAVHQVIRYCALRGAQIAIICNGPQLALFQAFIAGQSPLDGECYFFDGFQAYIDYFPLLWRLLSPEGISENRAYRELALHRNPRTPPKASSSITEPMKYRYRNSFQENLRILAQLLLEEIEEDPKVKPSFYADCYVPIEANNRHVLLSKKIIAARYGRVTDSGISPAQLDSNTVAAGSGKLEISGEIIAASLSTKPIVVVGDVGVGKTSFFENLFEQLDTTEKQNTYFIHINLGTKATLSKDIKTHVLGAIPAVLKEKYGIDIDSASFVNAIYHANLSEFENSVYGALRSADPAAYLKARVEFLAQKVNHRDAHLQAALGHLAHGRKKQVILVIDNADQRSYETQQEAFLIAQEMAASRNVIVFVSLRPSTFYQSKLTGALSGYQSRVLTIAPPPTDAVLKKRISFALRVAEGKAAPGALAGIKLHLNNIVLFLTATLRSIRDNEQIQIFLSNITGGNTRLVIELVSGFCGSPNVDSQKIVRIEEEQGNYKVPLHEFAKHALLGEYAYYNPQSSLVACNIFDVSSADPREHFIAALLIANMTSSQSLKDNDGFMSGVSIVKEIATFGFLEDQVRFALRRLATHRLIETPHGHYREIKVAETDLPDLFHFRATSIGVYHLRYWMGSFAFLDAVSTDTPIFDPAVRGIVFDRASSIEIGHRLERAIAFRDYLLAQWNLSNIDTNHLDFNSLFHVQGESFNQVSRVVEGLRNPRRT